MTGSTAQNSSLISFLICCLLEQRSSPLQVTVFNCALCAVSSKFVAPNSRRISAHVNVFNTSTVRLVAVAYVSKAYSDYQNMARRNVWTSMARQHVWPTRLRNILFSRYSLVPKNNVLGLQHSRKLGVFYFSTLAAIHISLRLGHACL